MLNELHEERTIFRNLKVGEKFRWAHFDDTVKKTRIKTADGTYKMTTEYVDEMKFGVYAYEETMEVIRL